MSALEVEDLAVEQVDHLDELVDGPADIAQCRVCGCTDNDCSECVERTGQPCWWVEPDKCSACVTS
jgi:hypothetical protein